MEHTTVVNLATGDEITFSLPPLEALCAAVHCHTRKSVFTDIATAIERLKPEVIVGEHTIGLGDFCVFKEGRTV